MRLTLVIMVILTAVFLVSHAAGEANDVYCPPRFLDNYEELDAWAKTSTAFGGSLSGLRDGDNVIYHAARYWDRRGGSTESNLYRFAGESLGYELILHLPERLGFNRQLAAVDGAITVSRWRENSSDTTRMLLSFEMFPESAREHGFRIESLDPPREIDVEVSRDLAFDIARVALQEDGLKVLTLQLVRDVTWGVYWRAVTESEHLPDSAHLTLRQRVLGIDADSGRIVQDTNIAKVIAPDGPGGVTIREVAP